MRLVVVGNYTVYAQFPGEGHLVDRRDAAINRDEQVGFRRQLPDRPLGQAVPFVEPVRDIVLYPCAELLSADTSSAVLACPSTS